MHNNNNALRPDRLEWTAQLFLRSLHRQRYSSSCLSEKKHSLPNYILKIHCRFYWHCCQWQKPHCHFERWNCNITKNECPLLCKNAILESYKNIRKQQLFYLALILLSCSLQFTKIRHPLSLEMISSKSSSQQVFLHRRSNHQPWCSLTGSGVCSAHSGGFRDKASIPR